MPHIRRPPPPPPRPPPDPGALPHPLTFFLTSSQRRAVLRALRRRSGCRATALLMALGVGDDGEARKR